MSIPTNHVHLAVIRLVAVGRLRVHLLKRVSGEAVRGHVDRDQARHADEGCHVDEPELGAHHSELQRVGHPSLTWRRLGEVDRRLGGRLAGHCEVADQAAFGRPRLPVVVRDGSHRVRLALLERELEGLERQVSELDVGASNCIDATQLGDAGHADRSHGRVLVGQREHLRALPPEDLPLLLLAGHGLERQLRSGADGAWRGT